MRRRAHAPAPAANARPRVDELRIRFNSIEGAKRHSDTNFLVLPSQEYYGSPLGGHTDLLFSHPVYWEAGRAANQALTETHPKYGTVYRLGGADDLMEMARRENMLITMPHPAHEGSTGFPDSIRHLPFFGDRALPGCRLPVGNGTRSFGAAIVRIPLPSAAGRHEQLAGRRRPAPRYLLSISEVRHQQPGDDIYASSPVSYVKMDALPEPNDVSPLIGALMRGDYFVTSGEVLISGYTVKGTGAARTIEADVEWTFPLNFVEVVWGNGSTTDRQIVSRRRSRRFRVAPLLHSVRRRGKKWVRFAAWDVAGTAPGPASETRIAPLTTDLPVTSQ